MRHRADIDGLRAFAIAPVVLFHAGHALVPGGYLGVDIFFVISGFLITSILIGDLDGGRFSLLQFYRRRIVRLLPALFVVLAGVLALGWWLLLPFELRDLARSAAAAATFVANIYFWKTADYFGAAPEAAPLLNTWSLGVEEQFYLLFPLALAGLHRAAPRLLPASLAAATVASLAIAGWAATRYPMPAFYLLPARGWELGLGAFAAALPTARALRQPARETMCIVAIAAILASFWLFDQGSGTPFPAALPACLGATTLLLWAEETRTGQALAWPPLRWLGLISYSLYLWHWPIFSLYRIRFGYVQPPAVMAGLILVALAAATLSYRFVERPARARRNRMSAGRTVLLGLSASVALAGFAWGLAAVPRGNWLRPDIARVERYLDFRSTAAFRDQYRSGCGADAATASHPSACVKAGARNVLVIGDSHAKQIWRAIAARVPTDNVILVRCRLTLDQAGTPACLGNFNAAVQPVMAAGPIAAVVLPGRWRDGQIAQLPALVRYFRAHGATVTVIGPVVEYDGEVPALLARAMLIGDRNWIERARRRDRERLDRALGPAARAVGARYHSAYRAECPLHRACRLFGPDGSPLHFDYGHLTPAGAALVAADLPRP